MQKRFPLNIVQARGKWYVYLRGTNVRLLSGVAGTRRDVDEWIGANGSVIEAAIAESDRRFLVRKEGWRRDAAEALHRTTAKRASTRSIGYDLSADVIEGMLRDAGDRCSVSGLEFVYLPKAESARWHRRPFMPSIDRMDNAAGYTVANVRPVAVCVNIAINEWGEDVYWTMVKSSHRVLQK